jgi:hypothetical protein
MNTMRTFTAYSLGDRYSFVPPAAHAERVTVALREGIEVREDRSGMIQVFLAGTPSGFSLTTALTLEWCSVLEKAPEK